jgi:hypothetical protein
MSEPQSGSGPAGGGTHAFPETVGTTFVGREPELALLHAGVEQACARRGRLILVSGAPGIGKTRTCEEVAVYARERGARVLWGRCYEGAGAPAFWPWVQVLRTALWRREADELAGLLGAGGPDIAQLVPELRVQLPGLPAPRAADSPEARFQLFDSIGRFLAGVAERTPLLVVLDDLHEADRPSQLLLQFFVQQLQEMRICVVGTHRDLTAAHPLSDTVVEVCREPATERVVLRRWSTAEVARFIEAQTGVSAPAAAVAALCEQTEGNPLFVGEFIRTLIAEGRRCDLTAASSWEVTVTRGVKAVITAHEVGMPALEHRVSGLRSLVSGEADVPTPESADRKPAPRDREMDTRDLQLETIFRKVGEYWTIAYAGSVVRLKECKGLQYIASLLSHPGQEFLALELVQGSGLGEQRSGSGNQRLPLLDVKARTAYRQRLAELREELHEAERNHDSGRRERVRQEIDFVGNQLTAAVGLGGRSRMGGTDAERARSALTKRIGHAVKRIEAGNPALARHLRRTIKTGIVCAYLPDPYERVSWRF